jgi:hypothetical protein
VIHQNKFLSVLTFPDSFTAGLARGLVQPSGIGLLGALFTALSIGLLGALLLTERRVASAPRGAWMQDRTDDYGRLTPMVLRGAAAFGTGTVVWILGASDTMEMLLGESELNDRLAKYDGGGARIVSLCASGLLLEERAAVVERLHPGASGAVVLGVNLGQFCRPVEEVKRIAERHKLGFRSAAFDEEAAFAGAVVPSATGQFFYDNRLFFLKRVACLVRTGPPPEFLEHRSHAWGGTDADPWQFRKVRRFSSEEFERRTGVVSRLVARNRLAGGPPVVLLEIPTQDYLEPRIGGPNHAAEVRIYRAAVRRLAEREGLHYLDPAASISLRSRDFADYAHLGDEGARARFSDEFLRQLSPILEGVRP